MAAKPDSKTRERLGRLKISFWAVATLASYMSMWFIDIRNIESRWITPLIVTAFLLTLLVLVTLNLTEHERVMKVTLGLWSLVATACAVGFIYYGWTARQVLDDMGFLVFFAAIALVAAASAMVAWRAFWRSKW